MTEITDEHMRAGLTQSRAYTLVLLTETPKRREPGADAVVWEHGRRNFALRAQGVLPIVCPVTDDSSLSGIGIFDASPEQVAAIMDEDPGVKAGLFSYEIHPVRGFPGSVLPG